MANIRKKHRNIRPGVGRGKFTSKAPQPLVSFKKELMPKLCVENIQVSIDLTKGKETLLEILSRGTPKVETAAQLYFTLHSLSSKSTPPLF